VISSSSGELAAPLYDTFILKPVCVGFQGDSVIGDTCYGPMPIEMHIAT